MPPEKWWRGPPTPVRASPTPRRWPWRPPESGRAGGTLVVTLEPCDHAGRTPPCTSAILASGVSRVLVGAEDPD